MAAGRGGTSCTELGAHLLGRKLLSVSLPALILNALQARAWRQVQAGV